MGIEDDRHKKYIRVHGETRDIIFRHGYGL